MDFHVCFLMGGVELFRFVLLVFFNIGEAFPELSTGRVSGGSLKGLGG